MEKQIFGLGNALVDYEFKVKDEDLKSIARYIVANPLRAELAQEIGEYPHWDSIWLE